MRQAEVIMVGGNSIIYLDFSELKKKEEIFEHLKIYGDFIKRQPLNSLSTLTNLEGMHFNTEIYNAFAHYVKENNPYVRQSAVIGMKGLIQIFYKGFVKLTGRNVKVCETRNEAFAALIKYEMQVV